MENYYYLSKAFASRFFNVPMEYLGDYVLTQRRSGSIDTFGIGIKLKSPFRSQVNMFVDLSFHKIAETSCASTQNPAWCKIYKAELKCEGDDLVLTTPYGIFTQGQNSRSQTLSYRSLVNTYQNYWFKDKAYCFGDLPTEDVFVSPVFYARHFNVPEAWLKLTLTLDLTRNRIVPVFLIKDTDLYIDVEYGTLHNWQANDGGKRLKEKDKFFAVENGCFRKSFNAKGELIYIVDSHELDSGEKINYQISAKELDKVYHDRLFYEGMRPLAEKRIYSVL